MKTLEGLSAIGVELAGSPLNPADAKSLGSVLVQQRLSLPSLCELRFFEPTGPLGQDLDVVIGHALKITVAGQSSPLFVGEVTAFEFCYGSDLRREVRVRGYDRLHRLRKRQPVRAHVRTDLADLAREMVSDIGLNVNGLISGVIYQRLMQTAQSDFELLTSVSQRAGLYFTVRENSLEFLTLQGTGVPVDLVLGQSLFEARIETNGDAACRQVTTIGWDPLRVDGHRGTAALPRTGRTTRAAVHPSAMGSDGNATLTGTAVQDGDDAEGLAQAELDVRTAREVILTGIAEGNTELQAGTVVNVKGVARSVEGLFVLSAVTHTCDPVRGYVSEIDTTPPARVADRTSSVAAHGIVTGVSDPERIGRVRVRFPAYDDLESEWMPVILPGAGVNKGIVALPDVGDHVLVLLPDASTSQGVILGGLYGSKGPHDSGVDVGAVKRFTIRTASGQQIRFDDSKKMVRVESSSGNVVELGPGKLRIHAATDLEISAPGRAIVITASTIDFKKG